MINTVVKGCQVKNPITLTELYSFSKQRFSNGYFFNGESHDFYEVVCVLKGRVGVTAGKRVYVLSAGQMTVHRPGQFHAIWEEGESRPESIIFSFAAAPFPKIRNYVYELSSELVREIRALYSGITDAFEMECSKNKISPELNLLHTGNTHTETGIWVNAVKEGREGQAAELVKRLELFIVRAMRNGSADVDGYAGAGSEAYTRILSVMEENLGKELSVSSLAAQCKMSVPSLEKTVYKYLHCGAMTYYNILKLQKAHDYLLSGMSVKETAFTLGYSNQNYFSACFKKKYGYPPSAVRADSKLI